MTLVWLEQKRHIIRWTSAQSIVNPSWMAENTSMVSSAPLHMTTLNFNSRPTKKRWKIISILLNQGLKSLSMFPISEIQSLYAPQKFIHFGRFHRLYHGNNGALNWHPGKWLCFDIQRWSFGRCWRTRLFSIFATSNWQRSSNTPYFCRFKGRMPKKPARNSWPAFVLCQLPMFCRWWSSIVHGSSSCYSNDWRLTALSTLLLIRTVRTGSDDQWLLWM